MTVLRLTPTSVAHDRSGLAERLRELAGDIEKGDCGEVDAVVLLLDSPAGVARTCLGRPFDMCRLVGLLEYAKAAAIENGE